MLTKCLLLAAMAVIAVTANELDARIIGGEEVGRDDARYVAQIFEVISDKYGERQVKFVGTGAFISGRTIVTAASLFQKHKKYVIRYGSNNIIYSGHAEIDIYKILRPPKCDPENRENNIALVILAHSITECSACRDIEFLELQIYYPDATDSFETVGFGYMNQPCYHGDKKSTVLRKTGMTLLSDHKCKKLTNNANQKGRLLCTRPNNYISTVCSGDEGAPLVEPTWKALSGVMNYGDEYCETGAPVVYTAIPPFAMWISKNMVY